MTVLVLAGERDLSADAIIWELEQRDVPVVRIDLAWFPQALTVAAAFRRDRWEGRLRTAHRAVDVEEIRAILYRTPGTFRFPTALTGTRRQHAHNEAKLGVGGILMSLPVLWINHPGNQADSAYKPLQLAAAAQCGLQVPDTLVTNDPEAVHHFVGSCGQDGAVTKMLGAAAIMEPGGRRVAYTDRVHADHLGELPGIELTAHQFQRWVGPKRYEARMIVIGEQRFTIGIHAQTAATRLDWRRDYTALRYEVVEPPPQIAIGVSALMRRFGLVYGALDFVVTAQGWTLLEVNGGGQYGWLDDLDEVREYFGRPRPITGALADLLSRGAT